MHGANVKIIVYIVVLLTERLFS